MGVVETVRRMMADRGLTELQPGDSDMLRTLKKKSMAIFHALYGRKKSGADDSVEEGGSDAGFVDLVVVFFFSDKMTIQTARDALAVMEEFGLKKAVGVAFDVVTSAGRKELLDSSVGRVQLFASEEIENPYVDHCYVPKHELYTQALPATFKKEHLSKIADSDPVIRWYDWAQGDIIKVTKVYGELPPQFYYFQVVSSLTLPMKKQ